MASENVTIKFNGLDEFKRDLETVISKYPNSTNSELMKVAGEFTKTVNDEFPSDYSDGKMPFPKNWAKEKQTANVYGASLTVAIGIRNKAHHWHLVEHGHDQYGRSTKKHRGPLVGVVAGRKYIDEASGKWETRFPARMEEYVDKMLRKNNL